MTDTDPSKGIGRRRLLVAGAMATAGVLAGCVGSTGSGDGNSDGGSGDGNSDGNSDDGGSDSGGGTDGDSNRLTLTSLDVEGSPGGQVVVEPPEQVVLLDFFATWCAPCKPQMSNLREIRDGFPGVHMLSITNESDESAVRSFWQEYEGTWPVALDPRLDASSRYSARRVPTLLVLDADGGEAWRHSGLAATDSIADALTDAGATRQ